MRVLVLVMALVVGLCSVSMALDFSKLNKDTMAVFISAFPQYKALLVKYGADASDPTVLEAQQYTAEIQALLGKFGMTLPDFAQLMQKISMGFAAVQMEASGMNMQMLGGMANMPEVSDAEKDVVRANMSVLKRLFEVED